MRSVSLLPWSGDETAGEEKRRRNPRGDARKGRWRAKRPETTILGVVALRCLHDGHTTLALCLASSQACERLRLSSRGLRGHHLNLSLRLPLRGVIYAGRRHECTAVGAWLTISRVWQFPLGPSEIEGHAYPRPTSSAGGPSLPLVRFYTSRSQALDAQNYSGSLGRLHTRN